MEFMLDLHIEAPKQRIDYNDKILLVGSCFTEHIGKSLQELKFDVLQNPNGILFDPQSVASSLVSYIQNKQYAESDLFYLNELWQSWQHHSIFSNVNRDACLRSINESQNKAHEFLKTTKWLIITLGTSYSYHLIANTERQSPEGAGGRSVANCHKAPSQMFHKHLMPTDEINAALDNCLYQLFKFNPGLHVIFTVSPVRHIRDGIVDNNRSKARLIEVVHHLVNKFDKLYYFPAYELVIDVLRDYRFYDIDMVHPNYQATQFVFDQFMQHFVNEQSQKLSTEIQKIITARKHKPFQANTEAHKKFLQLHFEKTQALSKKFPFLNLDDELKYFSAH